MFSAFRGKSAKAPPPQVEVVGFDGDTLELKSAAVLVNGPLTVILLNAELELEKEAAVNIDQGFPDKQLYWASLPEGSELAAVLQPLIPKEAEIANAGGELPPSWEEKRGRVRLNRVLGAMSPQVAGFKCVTHDIHSEGLRLQVDQPLAEGSTIKVRFELEDHRLPAFDVQGVVKWCLPSPKKGHWAGILFTQITDEQKAQVDKFVEETLSYEGGVLTRDYVVS